jgi:putative transcriptional regulator
MSHDMITPIRERRDLAKAIRQRRKKLNMTQAFLASMMGVSRQLIGELEKGSPGVNIGLVLDVCREIGLKLSYESDSNDNDA